MHLKDENRETGAFLLEAAIILILFFVLVFAIIEISFLIRRYANVQSALVRAAHALQGASAGERIMEDQSFQFAGNVFYDEIQRQGIPISEISLGKVVLAPNVAHDAILTGRKCTLLGGGTPPQTYRLMARLRWRPVVANFLGIERFDIGISTLAVIEAATSGARPQPTPNKFTKPITPAYAVRGSEELPVYMPALAITDRTQWVDQSKVQDSLVYDDYCS